MQSSKSGNFLWYECDQLNGHELGTCDLQENLLTDREKTSQVPKATVLQTIFNIARYFFGISQLATPGSFKESGLIGGVVGI